MDVFLIIMIVAMITMPILGASNIVSNPLSLAPKKVLENREIKSNEGERDTLHEKFVDLQEKMFEELDPVTTVERPELADRVQQRRDDLLDDLVELRNLFNEEPTNQNIDRIEDKLSDFERRVLEFESFVQYELAKPSQRELEAGASTAKTSVTEDTAIQQGAEKSSKTVEHSFNIRGFKVTKTRSNGHVNITIGF